MQALLRRLRGFGSIGSTAADILTFLATNWVLTVSTLVAIWASLNEWATEFIHSRGVQTFFEAFLALIWTIVGLCYLYDRNKPRPIRAVPVIATV